MASCSHLETDIDPEVYDRLPQPDLSGEWADGYSADALCSDAFDAWPEGWQYGTEDEVAKRYDATTLVFNEYEAGFQEAVVEAVVEHLRRFLAPDCICHEMGATGLGQVHTLCMADKHLNLPEEDE